LTSPLHDIVPTAVAARVQTLDWEKLSRDLDACGNSIIRTLLEPRDCAALIDMYRLDGLFRNRVIMARHGFGRGEYRYFRYPLPDIIHSLRTSMYSHLAQIANRWNQTLGIENHYPEEFDDFITRCHRAGQSLPTPLLLHYGVGDFNCLHQDLYGEHVFPIQLAIQLSEPGRDFDGGEFVLTEQRPRMQSRVEVLTLKQGDAVVFPVQLRPVKGSRGYYRVNMRHGVSKIRAGERYTAGIIFHDAT
jgi:hypothetical protein